MSINPKAWFAYSGEALAVNEFFVVGGRLILPIEADPVRWISVEAVVVLPPELDLSPAAI